MRPGSSHIDRGGRRLRRDARRGAFTLVEVILAIAIATGLLVIALTFYRQATDLRGQILAESERISVIRLVADRLTADLRQAQPVTGDAESFVGGSGWVRFTLGLAGGAFRARARRRDHRRTRCGPGLVRHGDRPRRHEHRGPRLDRTESPLSARPRAEGSVTASVSFAPLDPSSLAPAATNRPVELLTDQVRFIRFRFWDGGAWQESWTNQVPPIGVEVVLGTEPLPDDATPETYPYEQFRRVVVVPAGSRGGATTRTASPPRCRHRETVHGDPSARSIAPARAEASCCSRCSCS